MYRSRRVTELSQAIREVHKDVLTDAGNPLTTAYEKAEASARVWLVQFHPHKAGD